MNNFVWVIRNNLASSLLIPDLNPPSGLKIAPYRTIALHSYFSLHTLNNSSGLQYAITHGHVTNIEKIIPEDSQLQPAQPQNLDVLQQQIGSLTNMVADLISKSSETTPPVIIEKDGTNPELLQKIINKLDKIDVGKGQKNPSGFKELSPEMAALKSRESAKNVKVSNFETIGKREEVASDNNVLKELGEIDLDDINLDDV